MLELNFKSLTDDDTDIIEMLTHHQLLGVKYYHDLEQRIPYKEIQADSNGFQSAGRWANSDDEAQEKSYRIEVLKRGGGNLCRIS